MRRLPPPRGVDALAWLLVAYSVVGPGIKLLYTVVDVLGTIEFLAAHAETVRGAVASAAMWLWNWQGTPIVSAFTGLLWLLHASNRKAALAPLPSPLVIECGNTPEFEQESTFVEHLSSLPTYERHVKFLKVTNTGDVEVKGCRAWIETTAVPLRPSVTFPLPLTWDGGWQEARDILPRKSAQLWLYWDERRIVTGTITDYPPGLAVHQVPFTVKLQAAGFDPVRRQYCLQEALQRYDPTHPSSNRYHVPTIVELR